MSDWTQVGENLVKHRGGTIYLRAKVRGKVIRVSLDTEDLRIAKISRDDRLLALRSAAATTDGSKIRTVGDALAEVATVVLSQPHLRPKTLGHYREILAVLKETLPIAIHGKSWTPGEAAKWWKRTAVRFHAQRANNLLMMARKVGKQLVAAGVRLEDPTETLKRIPVRDKDRNIPSLKTLQRVVAEIRSVGFDRSEEAADFVEFLAFGGPRLGQAQAFEWKHDEGKWLKFPSGIDGTKGADTRRLPVNGPLRKTLDRLKARTGKTRPSGKIFKLQSPRHPLENACKRLGIAHIRIHDLRHFFASWCIEQGVDIPTVAKWLGHKDGGRLLMRTYAHVQDKHSLSSAKKLCA